MSQTTVLWIIVAWFVVNWILKFAGVFLTMWQLEMEIEEASDKNERYEIYERYKIYAGLIGK